MTATAPGTTPPPRLSRTERTGLSIPRGLDPWLSPLGVWVYRRTHGAMTRPWKVDALLLHVAATVPEPVPGVE